MECKARHWAMQDLGSYIPTSHLRCPIYLPLNNVSGDDKKRCRCGTLKYQHGIWYWKWVSCTDVVSIRDKTCPQPVAQYSSEYFPTCYFWCFLCFHSKLHFLKNDLQSLALCSDSLRSDEILEAMKKNHVLMRNLRFGRQVHPSVYCFVLMHTPNPQI